jgi:tRNA A-37 threonylcarbamoyl transferase component Bud32
LSKLNAGVFYGFSQVGKFVTVYPHSTEAAIAIASELHALTANQPAPAVPYDNPLRKESCIYYRYGGFSNASVTFRKKSLLAIVRPDGKLVPDLRAPGAAVPRWLTDPFQPARSQTALEFATPLETDYTAYKALVQRGRGGVYQARDLTSVPAKLCVIKEGRRHGEADLRGRDGFHRIKREAQFLQSTSAVIAAVPRILTTFTANGCFYLVMEPIDGRSLQQIISSRERISTRRMLKYSANMARIVADIHAAGWAWRDCKPANFYCQKNHELRALDFEGVCRLHKADPLLWATPDYTPSEWRRNTRDLEAADLYALGTSIMQLIAKRSSFANKLLVAFQREIRKRKLPQSVAEAIRSLHTRKPKTRPSARATQRLFEKLLRNAT